MAVLIAVWGAAPGIGKSTVCAGLAQWLVEAGLNVDHFAEEEVLTRPQFAEVAAHFRATGSVEAATLLAAASQFARSVLAGDIDLVAADALVPFVPTLLAAAGRVRSGCSGTRVSWPALGSRQDLATCLQR